MHMTITVKCIINMRYGGELHKTAGCTLQGNKMSIVARMALALNGPCATTKIACKIIHRLIVPFACCAQVAASGFYTPATQFLDGLPF